MMAVKPFPAPRETSVSSMHSELSFRQEDMYCCGQDISMCSILTGSNSGNVLGMAEDEDEDVALVEEASTVVTTVTVAGIGEAICCRSHCASECTFALTEY
jgi:hypothetical protein